MDATTTHTDLVASARVMRAQAFNEPNADRRAMLVDGADFLYWLARTELAARNTTPKGI